MKIIQILVAPENSTYQGCILGLGDDGVVYVCGKGEAVWSVYIPTISVEYTDENEKLRCELSRLNKAIDNCTGGSLTSCCCNFNDA